MTSILKILSVFFTCTVLFCKAGVPAALLLFKDDFITFFVVCTAGGITGNVVFTNLSAILLKKIHAYRAKKGLIHKKPIFTRFNRRVISIKNRFGLLGLATITPLVLSTPLGAFLAERFFKDKKTNNNLLKHFGGVLGIGVLFFGFIIIVMKKTAAIEHIFFDLDDTLWDFQSNSEAVLKELFNEFEFQNKLKCDVSEFLEEYKKINFKFWSLYAKGSITKAELRENRFQTTFKRFGFESEHDNLAVSQAYIARAPLGKKLKADCVEVLEYLKMNYKLHIITNGFKEIQHVKIKSAQIGKYFDKIIISEEYALCKPDARVFRLAESLSGATNKNSVMIGDHLENDVLGALDAGWKAIHLDNENSNAHSGDRILQLKELKQIF